LAREVIKGKGLFTKAIFMKGKTKRDISEGSEKPSPPIFETGFPFQNGGLTPLRSQKLQRRGSYYYDLKPPLPGGNKQGGGKGS